jgi:hypothetical protein
MAFGRPRSFVTVAALTAALLVAAWVGAGADPNAETQATLDALEARRAPPSAGTNGAVSGDAGAAPMTPPSAFASAETPIREARQALERAKSLRASGDVARAQIVEATALEWALTARDEIAAVELGAEADEAAVGADDAGAIADRARKMLDDAIARRSKLQGSLDELDHEAQLRALDAGPRGAPDAKAKKAGKP